MKDLPKPFGNATKLKILFCLLGGDKSVTDLIKKCRLSQSSVSQHLKKLRDIGYINCAISGKQRIYRLKNKKAGKIAKEIIVLVNKL